MSTLEIVARNSQVRPEFMDTPNPLLVDPGIHFVEGQFVEYEQQFGKEGDVSGFLKCVERWSKANSPVEAR